LSPSSVTQTDLAQTTLGLSKLRRLTLTRATGTYWRWVERSIGWGTLIWLVAWLVFYAVAASQVVIFNVKSHTNDTVPLVMLVVFGLGLNYAVLTRRTPPVILNRQDLYRLGLAPLTPRSVLAWEFSYSRGVLFALGVLIGLVWWLIGYAFFGLQPYLAPVAIGLWFAAALDWGWLQYVGFKRIWIFPALTVVGVVLDRVLGFGFSSALVDANPLNLVLPAVALVAGIVFSRASLQGAYPPQFASQSLILSQLRAMNLTAAMVQRPPDPDVRRRLLQNLNRKEAFVRPVRFLPVPKELGAAGFIAWRVALTLYRRSLLEQLALVAQILFFVFSSANIIQGLIGTLVLAVALSVLTPRLLGPSFTPMPVDVPTRTLGRSLPGILIVAGIAALSLLASPLIPALTPGTVLSGALHALLALVMLEKLSHRFGVPPASRDVALGAALFAVLPEATLGILGLSSNLLSVQLGLLFLLLWQPFL
jgi:hypothetical protein